MMLKAKRHPAVTVLRALWPWLLVAGFGLIGYILLRNYLNDERHGETIVWRSKKACWLALGGALVGVIAFHLQRRRAAAIGFSQVGLVGSRGVGAWLSDLPSVLRVLAIVALAIGLARPETYRTIVYSEDSIDIMLVVDMSKSMEETDLPRDRMDAAQRVLRRFLRRTRHDRVGLVIFGQQAMLQCPLTSDTKMLEQMVSDLAIGDVPELGTAIGDGLGMALAQLRRSDAKAKIAILLSDGDNNWVTQFEPDEAARLARDMRVKVFTVLVGADATDWFNNATANPATLRNIAQITGGQFFRAQDYGELEHSFDSVRQTLDKTRRTVTERVPDRELFAPIALLAGGLLLVELLLSVTRFRRFP